MAPLPSHEIPDWTREAIARGEWSPAKRLLEVIRKYQSLGSGPVDAVRKKKLVLQHRFWSAVSATDIPLNTVLGGGLLLPHPTGIVMHPEVEVGPNCLLFQNVTLGMVETKEGAPRLEGGVDVGAGAKILGPVHVGHHASIGANAVVTRDVEPYAIMAGIPAKRLGYREQKPEVV